MGQDFACNTFLIFECQVSRKVRAVFDNRFLRVRGFAVNQAHVADQLVPGLAIYVAVFSSINCGQLPFLLPGKRATAATGPGIQLYPSFSCATLRAASAGAQAFPAIAISRYSSARASVSWFRISSSFLTSSQRWASSFLASVSSEPASARDNLSAIDPTSLSNCLRLSKSLSRTLTHRGRNSGTM